MSCIDITINYEYTYPLNLRKVTPMNIYETTVHLLGNLKTMK